MNSRRAAFRRSIRQGLFIHACFNIADCHRLHGPALGRVLESRVIASRRMLEVVPEPLSAPVDPLGADHLSPRLPFST